MATITGTATEPQATITAPTPGSDIDAWGDILNDTTLTALLGYVLWLHERTPAEPIDPNDFATSAQGALADTAVQPGDPLTDLSSGAATSGHVPKADGSGGIAWAAESGGGGGGDIALADGLVIVKHGSAAATARPAAGSVYWQGSVAPTNRAVGDWWLETSVYD